MNSCVASIMRCIRPRFQLGLGRLVTRALNVGPLGSRGRERLQLRQLTGHLQVVWQARALHPWDRDLPSARRSELFSEQTIADTDVAVAKLFRLLPEIDTISIQVRAPEVDGSVILAGTISRASVAASSPVLSPRMRLKLMGIHY